MSYLIGAGLLAAWMVVGFACVALLRRDLIEDTAAAVFNMLAWPLIIFTLPAGIYVRRRDERARQQRITEKVMSGAYTAEYARNKLNWKG